MTWIPKGSVSFASDVTTAALIRTDGTASAAAVMDRILPVVADVVAGDSAVAAAAAAAVGGALADESIVTAGAADTSASMTWGIQDVAVPSTVPATVPALATVPVTRDVVVLTGGKIDPDLLPSADDGSNLADELAVVAGRGRPQYAPSARSFDPARSLYNFHPGQLAPWMVARERARRGLGNAVILSLGTSISRIIADPQAGETYPDDAWPGQTLARLDLPIGGTGIRHVSTDIPVTSHVGGFAEPTITIANPETGTNKVEALALGFAQASFVTITDSGSQTAYVEFNTAAGSYTELWLYGADISGTSVVTVDGTDRTWAGSTAVGGAFIPCEAGFASGQRVGKLTLSAGTHTIRVHGTAAGVPFGGFEGRNTTGVILHRGAIAGRSQQGFFNTTGNTDGLAWAIDPWNADLVLDELHINDWQNHYAVATFKAQKIELWQRARDKGAAVLAIIAPTPDLSMYPTSGGNVPPVTDYITAIYEAANETDVAVLDLTHRWVDYPTSAGFFRPTTDHIHPTGVGASDIAGITAATLLA